MSLDKIIIEDKQFDFLSAELPRPISEVRRYSNGSDRYYYTIGEKDNVEITLYSSGTRLISDGYAEDTIHLEDWRNKLKAQGKNPKVELEYLATRGTLMHYLLGDFIAGREITLSNLGMYFQAEHPESISIPQFWNVINNDNDWLVKAVLSFSEFVKEYKVKPMAIELMLKSDKYSVATPVDMICEMAIEEKGFFGEVYKAGEKKGMPKESKQEKVVTAIVDFKSSENGFFDKHFFQLQLNKRIFEENYPDRSIDRLFNWSPKAWISEPTFNLKDQTDGPLIDLCDCVFEQGRIKHLKKVPVVRSYISTIKINSDSDESLFSKTTLVEYLTQIHGGKDN